MAQKRIRIAAIDRASYSITVAYDDGKRVEYFVPRNFSHLACEAPKWLNAKWYNHTISELTKWSDSIQNVDAPRQRKPIQQEYYGMAIETKDYPTDEFKYTVIAPSAKNGISYPRKWLKSIEDATKFSAEIFEEQHPKKFELVIVTATEILSPKPQIELDSRKFT